MDHELALPDCEFRELYIERITKSINGGISILANRLTTRAIEDMWLKTNIVFEHYRKAPSPIILPQSHYDYVEIMRAKFFAQVEKLRGVDYYFYFPSKVKRMEFKATCKERKIRCTNSEDDPGTFGAVVTLKEENAPLIQELEQYALNLGGEYDGWSG